MADGDGGLLRRALSAVAIGISARWQPPSAGRSASAAGEKHSEGCAAAEMDYRAGGRAPGRASGDGALGC